LQNGRAAEPAMSKEQFLCEGALADGGADGSRDAGKAGKVVVLRAVENQGHESRARLNDGNAKLSRQIVPQSGGANFGDGEPAGGHEESRRGENGILRGNEKCGQASLALYALDLHIQKEPNVSHSTFGEQHVHDLLRRSVAEELAEGLLVVSDAMTLNQGNEVRRRVAGERRFGKMPIGGEEVVRASVNIGEIAAASAGDEDLPARPIGTLEHGDAPAAAASFDSSHEASSAGAEDDDVEGVAGDACHADMVQVN